MVELFCVVVGEKGSAFQVTIDASESVDHLKDAIALEEKCQFAANKLQLFLARKNDDTWLDSSAAEALTLDGNEHPEGFLHIDPPLCIKNPKYFGETFQPNVWEIHVLVVVPKCVTRDIITTPIHTWIRHFH